MIPARHAVWFAPFLLALAGCSEATRPGAAGVSDSAHSDITEDSAEDPVDDAMPDNDTGNDAGDLEDIGDHADLPNAFDTGRADDEGPDDSDDVATDARAELDDTIDDATDTDVAAPDIAVDSDSDGPCLPDCGVVEICEDAVCIDLRGAPCEHDHQCGRLGVCGLGGVCAAAAPVGMARLVDRSELLAGIWPEGWIFDSALSDPIGYGSASVFYEGPDNTLTLLVAGRSDAPHNLCRFRLAPDGASVDGTICDTSPQNAYSVAYLPPHASLPQRLVVGGLGAVTVSGPDLDNPIELLATTGDLSLTGCVPTVLLPLDANIDGILDLIVGCHATPGVALSRARTIVFRGLPDGTFDEMPERFAEEFENRIYLLASSTHDFDNDGLLDHFLVVDTFSSPERRNTTHTPGYVVRRCSPLEDCFWERVEYAEGSAVYTSHMGISEINVDTIGSLYVLSDLGPRQYLDMSNSPPADLATLLQIGLGYDAAEDEFLYSWSHIVADLDRNGLPDLFSTQGSPDYRRVRFGYQPEHQDLVFLQEGGGRFTVVDEYGWLATADGAPRAPFRSEYSRGAIELDLDLDGLLDIYITRFGRSPMLLEEVDLGHAPRCTLRFAPRYVPTTSGGIAVAADIAGPYITTTVQGDMRIQRPLRATVDHREGWVRFPSGAIAPYTCGESNGPIDVVEPDWLGIERNIETLTLTITPEAWPVAIAAVDVVFVDADRNRLGAATLNELLAVTNPVVTSADAFMIRINDRWVHRYFDLPRE